MIDEYEMGEDDHIKHATDLFIDFKVCTAMVTRRRSSHGADLRLFAFVLREAVFHGTLVAA